MTPSPPRSQPRHIRNLLFLGQKSHVVALDKKTGGEVWRTLLKGGMGYDFVTLLVEDDVIYAHTKGEAYGLDAGTGRILWKNELKGLGFGLASLAVEGMSTSPEIVRMKQISDEQSSSSSTDGM